MKEPKKAFFQYGPELILGIVVHLVGTFMYERLKGFFDHRLLFLFIAVVVGAAWVLLVIKVYHKGVGTCVSRDDEIAERIANIIHQAGDADLAVGSHNRSEGEFLDQEVLRGHLAWVERTLEAVVVLFRIVTGRNCRLWGAIRGKQENDQYVTFVRTQDRHLDRERSSKALGPDSKILKALTEADHKSECVIVTGPGRADWDDLDNDRFRENVSVIIGGVFAHHGGTHGPLRDKNPTWIVCINAAEDNLFNDSHKQLMQLCNVAFSLILNQLFALQARIKQRSP